MSSELSVEDKAFLLACEEEFKHRYTESDEEFMKVFNAEPSNPPIIDNWIISNRSGTRFDHKNRRFEPYNRNRSNRDRGYRGRRDEDYNNRGYSRGYNDYEQGDNHNNRDRFHRRHIY